MKNLHSFLLVCLVTILIALLTNVHNALIFLVVVLIYWHVSDRLILTRFQRWVSRHDNTPLPRGTSAWNRLFAEIYRLRQREANNRLATENALAQFDRTLWALPDGIILLDQLNCITWCNLAAERLLKINLQRDKGLVIVQLLRHPDFVALVAANTPPQQATPNGTSGPGANATMAANGQQIQHNPTIQNSQGTHLLPAGLPNFPELIIDHNGMRLCLSLINRATAPRILLVRDYSQREKTNRILRDFVGNASHELRTPLTVIIGYLELFVDRAPEIAEPSSVALKEAIRMDCLISDLLTLSRLENQYRPIKPKEIPLLPFLNDLLESAKNLSQDQHSLSIVNQTTDSDIPATAVMLLGDEVELKSALTNLLTNAIRYTPEGGSVTLGYCYSTNEINLSVTDSGIGIAAEHLPRLTERFYRVDQSRIHDKSSTGLGLSIVQQILLRHHSSLRVQSTPGKGSCFSFKIAGSIRQ